MDKRTIVRETARHVLWTDRENLLPHLLEHRNCGIWDVVVNICAEAGWTVESYLLAAVFDCDELLVEFTK